MRFSLAMLFAFCVLFVSTAGAQDKVFSGPQKGEKITPFKVLQVTNAEKVEKMEYAKADAEGPTLICFMKQGSEAAIGLLITLEFYASKHEKLNSHYVMLTEDKSKTEKMLRRWATRPFFSKSPMSISVDGIEGPGDYGLNRNVMATVLIAKDNKVIGNFALQDPSNNDAPDILASIAGALGKEKPSYKKIREEITAMRQKRNAERRRQNPIVKMAPNEDVGGIMLRMIYTEGNRQENARVRKEQLTKWAGDDEKKKGQLKKYCKAILKSDFELNQYTKAALQDIAKDK